MVLGFLTYALVYVQCDVDSSRVCPLPFEPHQIIERSTSNLNDILQHYQPIITKKATILNDKLQLHYSSILKSSTSILNQIYTQLDFLNDPRLQLAFANYFMLKDKLDQACEPLLASMSNHVDQLISRTVTFTKVQYLLLPTYRKILLSKVHGLAVLLVDNLIPRFKLELANSYHSAIAIINKSAISSRHALMKTWELVHFLIFMDSKKFAETVDKYPIVGKITNFYSSVMYPAYEKYLFPTGKIIVKHTVAIHADIMPIIRRSTVYSYIQPLFDLILYLKVEYYSPSMRAFMDYYERRGKSHMITVINVSKSAFKRFLHVVDQLWMVLEGRAELREKIHELLTHSKKSVAASETCQNIHHYCIKLTGQQKLVPKDVVNAPVEIPVNDQPPIDMEEADKTQVIDGSLTTLTKALEIVESMSQTESTILPTVQFEVFIHDRNIMHESTDNATQQESQTAEVVVSNFDDLTRNDVIAGPQGKDLKNLKMLAPEHEPKSIADETKYILDAQEIANTVFESEPPSNGVDFETGAVNNNEEQVYNEL